MTQSAFLKCFSLSHTFSGFFNVLILVPQADWDYKNSLVSIARPLVLSCCLSLSLSRRNNINNGKKLFNWIKIISIVHVQMIKFRMLGTQIFLFYDLISNRSWEDGKLQYFLPALCDFFWWLWPMCSIHLSNCFVRKSFCEKFFCGFVIFVQL